MNFQLLLYFTLLKAKNIFGYDICEILSKFLKISHMVPGIYTFLLFLIATALLNSKICIQFIKGATQIT